MNIVDLLKQALIIGLMLGAVKYVLGRFGGPLAPIASILG